MPNLGSVLKSEMSRAARKELRAETAALRKTVSQYRAEIAQLKRRLQTLEQQVKRLGRTSARTPAPLKQPASAPQVRFSARGFAAQRRRLGLSAAALARLLGVSALSVYKWESGKTRPRTKQLEAIVRLRRMGKREAAARLAA